MAWKILFVTWVVAALLMGARALRRRRGGVLCDPDMTGWQHAGNDARRELDRFTGLPE